MQGVNVIPIYLLRFENSSTCQQGDFKNLFGFLFLVFHLEVVLTSAHKLTYSSPQNLNLELIFKKASCFRHFLAKSMLANYTISRKSQHNAALYLFIFWACRLHFASLRVSRCLSARLFYFYWLSPIPPQMHAKGCRRVGELLHWLFLSRRGEQTKSFAKAARCYHRDCFVWPHISGRPWWDSP